MTNLTSESSWTEILEELKRLEAELEEYKRRTQILPTQEETWDQWTNRILEMGD